MQTRVLQQVAGHRFRGHIATARTEAPETRVQGGQLLPDPCGVVRVVARVGGIHLPELAGDLRDHFGHGLQVVPHVLVESPVVVVVLPRAVVVVVLLGGLTVLLGLQTRDLHGVHHARALRRQIGHELVVPAAVAHQEVGFFHGQPVLRRGLVGVGVLG